MLAVATIGLVAGRLLAALANQLGRPSHADPPACPSSTRLLPALCGSRRALHCLQFVPMTVRWRQRWPKCTGDADRAMRTTSTSRADAPTAAHAVAHRFQSASRCWGSPSTPLPGTSSASTVARFRRPDERQHPDPPRSFPPRPGAVASVPSTHQGLRVAGSPAIQLCASNGRSSSTTCCLVCSWSPWWRPSR